MCDAAILNGLHIGAGLVGAHGIQLYRQHLCLAGAQQALHKHSLAQLRC